jgi:formate dehydrogenase subunit beta
MMYDAIKKRVTELFNNGEIKGFLAPKNENGHIKPHLFLSSHELDQLSIGDGSTPGDARYPLAKILTKLLQNHSGECLGILVRGCDQRALKTLTAWNQIDLERVVSRRAAADYPILMNGSRANKLNRRIPGQWSWKGEPSCKDRSNG